MSAPSRPDDRTTAEGQAMIGIIRQMEFGLNESNTAKILDTFWDDGVCMAPGYETIIGKKGLKEAYDGLFGGIELSVAFAIEEVKVLSLQWGFVRTSMQEFGKMKNGKTEQARNQELFILKKRGVGWKIYEYCFNTKSSS